MSRMAATALLALLYAALPLRAQQRPWLLAELNGRSDDQPRRALNTRVEYGGYLSQATSLALSFAAQHVTTDHFAGTVAQPVLTGTLALPALRTGLAAGAGTLLGAPGDERPVLWHGRAAVGLGADVSLRAAAERARYDRTSASLDTVVLVRTVELALDRAAAPGWAAEAVLRRDDFGDANPVTTAFAWLLAPLSRSARHALRAGYAVAWQDTEQSRWTAAPGATALSGAASASGAAPAATAAPDATIPGWYDPYHTPHRALTHSILGEAAVAAGAAWLKLDASVGVRASETAAVLIASTAPGPPAGPGPPATPGPPAAPAPPTAPGAPLTPGAIATLHFYERSFTPYRVGASWTAPFGGHTSVALGAELSRTAFYRVVALRLSLARSL